MISEEERTLRNSISHDIGRVLGHVLFGLALPLLIVFLYGTLNLFTTDNITLNYRYTYVPLIGSMASFLCCVIYPLSMLYDRSWLAMGMAAAGLIPYLFALFVMLVLGVGRLYGLLSEFSILGLLAGIFWFVLGYVILYKFWTFTEVVTKADKGRRAILTQLNTKNVH